MPDGSDVDKERLEEFGLPLPESVTLEQLANWRGRAEEVVRARGSKHLEVIEVNKDFMECTFDSAVYFDALIFATVGIFAAVFALAILFAVQEWDHFWSNEQHTFSELGAFAVTMTIGATVTVPIVITVLSMALNMRSYRVRFIRNQGKVAVLRGSWSLARAKFGVHRVYDWHMLCPLFGTKLFDCDFGELELPILISDGPKLLDFIRLGRGRSLDETQENQWRAIVRYMEGGPRAIPFVRPKFAAWYPTPGDSYDRCLLPHEMTLGRGELNRERQESLPSYLFDEWARITMAALAYWGALLHWEPVWSRSVMEMSGQVVWKARLIAALRTLAGWLTFLILFAIVHYATGWMASLFE